MNPEEECIEMMMKKYKINWEQASTILLAIKKMEKGVNNGYQSNVQTRFCQEDTER